MRDDLLTRAWEALGGQAHAVEHVKLTGPAAVLPSRLPLTALAQATAAAAGLAAAQLAAARSGTSRLPVVSVDSRAASVAFSSEKVLQVDGEAISDWGALSRFFPTADGWIRLHGSYPHHRAAVLAALGIDPALADEVNSVKEALARRSAHEVEEAVVALGGAAAAVRSPDQWRSHPQGSHVSRLPLLSIVLAQTAPVRHLAAPPDRPLLPAAGLRVLDLTRVIAGPVATRTLALVGADVLRVDSPRLAELRGQQIDTGFGKRSTLLDLDKPGDRATFNRLLEGADAVIIGYRPGALDSHGLYPGSLLRHHPALVVATLNAWGPSGPWSGRRGFDSLVQAASGIAMIESEDSGEPGAMPVQALDHATGYLLAAAVLRAWSNQLVEGGGWHASLSLAQTAAWLISSGQASSKPMRPPLDPSPWLATVDAPAGRVTHALPAFELEGGPTDWSTPGTSWGGSAPEWLHNHK